MFGAVSRCSDREIKSLLLDWSYESAAELNFEPTSNEGENEQLPFPRLLANVGLEATPVVIFGTENPYTCAVMMQLLELELSGHVVAVSGGYIRKGRLSYDDGHTDVLVSNLHP